MLEFLIVLILIACNAFFALSELSVITSRKARLKQRAARSRGARRALELAEHPERFLSAVQIGITLMGILTGVLGGDAIGAAIGVWLGGHLPLPAHYAGTVGVALAVSLITFLTIVLGELLPKRLALLAPERLAAWIAWPMTVLSWAAIPAVWLLSGSVRWLLRLLRLNNTQAAQVSEEEIRLLVSESHEQGVIDTDERNMMHRVLRLGDRSAASLMTPRTRIAWLDPEDALDETLAIMRDTPFSRYPVYRGSDADVLGILEVKSLLGRLGALEHLFDALRPALFVSESTPAMKLLEILREAQQSLALVVDEYGEVTGLVTINDVMEAVLGRTTTHDGTTATPLVVTREDGSLLVDGSMTVDSLRELIGDAELPGETEHDYHTAAGMLIVQFGRIPNVGEYIEWNGWRMEVVDLDGPRVDKLLLQRLDTDNPASPITASPADHPVNVPANESDRSHHTSNSHLHR